MKRQEITRRTWKQDKTLLPPTTYPDRGTPINLGPRLLRPFSTTVGTWSGSTTLSTAAASSSTTRASPSSIDTCASDWDAAAPGTDMSAPLVGLVKAGSNQSLVSGLKPSRTSIPSSSLSYVLGEGSNDTPPSPTSCCASPTHRWPPFSRGPASSSRPSSSTPQRPSDSITLQSLHMGGERRMSQKRKRKVERKSETYQGHITLVGAHRDGGGVICIPHHPLHPPEELADREGGRGHPGTLHGSLSRYFIQAKPTLRQR